MPETLPFRYIATEAMYLSSTACPTAFRSTREKFTVRTGVIFLTIWPPTEPASREVRSPL